MDKGEDKWIKCWIKRNEKESFMEFHKFAFNEVLYEMLWLY